MVASAGGRRQAQCNDSDGRFCVSWLKPKQLTPESFLYIFPSWNWPKQEFAQNLED